MSDNITQSVSLELDDGVQLWVEARSLVSEEDVGIGDVLSLRK